MQLIISHIFSAFIFFQFIFVIHFLFIIIIILYSLLFSLLPTPHAFFFILFFSLNLSYNFSFLQKYSQTSGETSQLLNTQSLIARSTHLLNLTHHIRFIQLTLNNPTVTSMSPGQHGSLVHLLFWVQQVAWHIHYICLAQDAAEVRRYSRQVVYTLTAPRNNSLRKYIYYSRMLTQHTALISSIFMK